MISQYGVTMLWAAVQYCLPTDSPDLARQFGVVRSAMSPMLWSRYKPDRFDSWSAGRALIHRAVRFNGAMACL